MFEVRKRNGLWQLARTDVGGALIEPSDRARLLRLARALAWRSGDTVCVYNEKDEVESKSVFPSRIRAADRGLH